MFSKEFIQEIPKSDLHVHLDGSLRLATLIELAKEQNVSLPSYTPEGLMETVFKENYKDLPEYLQGFGLTCAVMRDSESLERIAYEFALDNAAEGVYYVEVRFGPYLHVHEKLDVETVIGSVYRGMDRAKKEINKKKAAEGLPNFDYGIIVSNLRMFSAESSDYYKKIMDALSWLPKKAIFAQASLQLARAAVDIRDRKGYPIVGFDLAGAEYGYPAIDHVEAFTYAHRNFMKKTVHAGEAYGAESIFQAITALHADRIGHGYLLFSKEALTNPEIADKEAYLKKLTEYIADRRITIEVCLTSNRQTNPNLMDISKHSLRDMLKNNLSVTLCTDNRLISQTSVSQEIELAIKNFDITPAALRNIVVYGFKRSFFHGTYVEKRKYVHSIIDYYEKICQKHGVPSR